MPSLSSDPEALNESRFGEEFLYIFLLKLRSWEVQRKKWAVSHDFTRHWILKFTKFIAGWISNFPEPFEKNKWLRFIQPSEQRKWILKECGTVPKPSPSKGDGYGCWMLVQCQRWHLRDYVTWPEGNLLGLWEVAGNSWHQSTEDIHVYMYIVH